MAETTWTQRAGMVSDEDTDNLESYAEQAEASKDAAAVSAAAAEAAKVAATASEAAALASKNSAATSATTATTGAATATTKASEAAASATSASTSATGAQTARTAAEAAETAAAASETASAASAAAASTSETNAASSASAASTSATNAGTSETNAATSASAASTSETNAAASETAASASETNAATSETNAATSESNAASSASAANTSASNAATSESNAASSASAASTSETNAATSASNASTSETNAASSASAAATSASEAATSAASINPDSIDINGGTIDGTVIGGSTPAAGSFTNTQLAEIAASKGVTAVDVFVYDTSKDSDGGAWRKRTQGTSWYNETLNTATRGSRREFPAVAVIVAESNKVTIYDGDDPSLPMWMVFLGSSGNMLYGGSITSVEIFDGVLCSASTAYALNRISLLEDAHKQYATSGNRVYLGNIEQRNDGLGVSSYSAGSIINNKVNDVAMTVLPDAPIDPATGLPVPTIAVATDGGVSVIKDDGTVVDITFSSLASEVVTLTEENSIWLNFASGSSDIWALYDIPNADTSTLSSITHTTTSVSGTGDLLNKSAAVDLGVSTDNVGAVFAGPAGLNFIDGLGNRLTAGSMVAYTTSTYNTGWMNGAIKGAFLSDTDDTDLVGSGELVTNGTDPIVATTGWVARANASLSVSGGDLVVTTPAAGVSRVYQAISVEVGQTYRITWDVTFSGAGFIVALGTSVGGTQVFSTSAAVGDRYFVATTTTVYFEFGCTTASTSDTYTLSSASAQLADADRSVNNNGLIVNGTVTKNPVSSGADLVAYSGFSTSNYLEQPYNSDLDFGTGDFCVMGWVKTSAVGTDYIIDARDATNTEGFVGFLDGSGHWSFQTKSAGSASTVNGTVGVSTNTWRHVVAVVSNSGAQIDLYVDGVLDKSSSVTARSIGGNNDRMIVGSAFNISQSFAGSLALLRISATAPTAEQIAKIYNDEKVLFQENAQATLYGSSDAVTALAHDDSTNLLHVGTSAGRSVFQGLRRVSNTTNAVGTAISASNGLVVEE